MATIQGYLGGISDEEWAQKLKNNELNAQRKKQAKEQAIKLGEKYYYWTGVDGSSGSGATAHTLSDTSSNYKTGGSQSTTNSSSATSSSSAANNLGNNDILSSLGLVRGVSGGLLDTAKDLARFRLDLDKEQGRFSRGLREEEAQSDFGRTTKLTEQQITGQKELEGLRQNATTQRLEKELQNRMDLMNTGNNFNLMVLSKNRAAALRGLR